MSVKSIASEQRIAVRALVAVTLIAASTAIGLPVAKGVPVPVTPQPPGYGHYCSIGYSGGGWAFATLSGAQSDPCNGIAKKHPGGVIKRAGLWSVNGGNNVLVTCSGGEVRVYRAAGSAATSQAYNESSGKKKCIFTVAPTDLPVFGRPYGPSADGEAPDADVSIARGFDYNVYRKPMDVSLFGQQPDPSHPEAHSVDRLGQQRCFINSDGDHVVPGEPAYDWRMPEGKPILSVADGIVRDARERDVSSYGCGPDKQLEVYVEHKVGIGKYAERFVSYYAHMSKILVQKGDTVTRGQKLGEAGNTGCSGGNHLHLGVLRLTNLSGRRGYAFATTPDGYGVNGIQGIIDPFGWGAPKHVDPWAWMFLGAQQDPYLGSVTNPGAFSINLWSPGQAPPSVW